MLFPLNYPEQPWQNKLIWINPNGKVIAEYLKLKPAPSLEPIIPGKGGIPILDGMGSGHAKCLLKKKNRKICPLKWGYIEFFAGKKNVFL